MLQLIDPSLPTPEVITINSYFIGERLRLRGEAASSESMELISTQAA